MSKISLISAVICDEVRREASGDAIIIGAKQNGPAISDDPEETPPPIGFYIELDCGYPPPSEISIRLRDLSNDEVVFQHTFEGAEEVPEVPEGADARGVLLMAFNKRISPVKEAGIYTLECCGDDEDWFALREVAFPTVDQA